MIQAIETKYNGYRFRSRLEARWAVFFDALGVRWEYEPEGYHTAIGGYLPDFWLKDLGFHVEIKPERKPTEEELIKALYLATDAFVYMLCGTPGVPMLKGGDVVDGPYAIKFHVAKGDDYFDEANVRMLAVQTIGAFFPGCWVPISTKNPDDMREILNERGETVGQLYRDFKFGDDDWHLYDIPTVQPDGKLQKDTMAVHVPSGRVVMAHARPWLWHEWPSGEIDMWCYPDYVPRKGATPEETLENLKSGDPKAFRPQQSVAKVNTPRLRSAYDAARSARFEHGETPMVPRGKPRKK